jgi:hypothetical protein
MDLLPLADAGCQRTQIARLPHWLRFDMWDVSSGISGIESMLNTTPFGASYFANLG